MDLYVTADPRLLVLQRPLQFLKELENKTFRVSLVTPILGLTFNDMYLARTASKLTKQLQKMVPEKKVLIQFTMVSIPPKFPCLKLTTFADKALVFEAYLFRVTNVETKGVCFLPFFCTTIQKSQSIAAKCKLAFQRRFSCRISNVEASEIFLKWMIGIVVHETLRRKKNEGMTISYEVPEMEGAHVHLTLDETSLFTLWSICYRGVGPELNEIRWDSITTFMDGLTYHFRNSYSLDVSELTLNRIFLEGTHLALKKDELRIKADDWGLVFLLLKFIESLCVRNDPSISPPSLVSYQA